MIKLRDYQEELLLEVLKNIPKHDRLCVQLSTGGGKTVIFTEMINRLNDHTLILVDSIELIGQTVNTFSKNGIDIGALTAGKKMPQNKVVVAMVQTIFNRLKKDKDLAYHFKYCIVDECHTWAFNKIFPFIPKTKIIGFTATPVRLKRYKIDDENTAVEVMADVYDKLICGKSIKWLIQNKYLVKDENHQIDFDYSGLKTDASGEFTADSMKKVFQDPEYQKALRATYDFYCDSKKTMIFTSCTETNLIYAELFSDKNVKTYDSNNNTPKERDGIIEWFKNTPDAILINTGCFTKGFDVCDVECIMVARATKSLATWIQIVGRGARITQKTMKDRVIVIDGGNNINEHSYFSFERDWYKIFEDRKIKAIIEPTNECEECEYIFLKSESCCPNCGWEVPAGEEKEKKEKQFEIKGEKLSMKPPTIDVDFFLKQGKTDYQCLKALKDKWVTFLVKLDIEQDKFERAWHSGEFERKFAKYLRPIYFKIIGSPLKKGKNVVYKNYIKKIVQTAYTKKYEIQSLQFSA